MGTRMADRRWLLIGGIAIVVVSATFLATWLEPSTQAPLDSQAGASVTSGAVATAEVTPTPTAAPSPSPDPTASPVTTPPPDPTARGAATPTPAATVLPTPTDPPIARGDPSRLYAEFLLRVNGDRVTVGRLNDSLAEAAQAQDAKGVHDASVDILDFADGERDWLRDHPPASCYAKAHRAARVMVADYGAAAERFLDWAGTGGGLTGLTALQPALDAVDVATRSLDAFGRAMDATTCPR